MSHPTRTCVVEGCDALIVVKSRGLCNTHYIFARTHNFLATSHIRASLAEEIWQRIERQPNGCWHWIGAIDNNGYGYYGKPRQQAHRLIYELLVGPIRQGAPIDHECHNRDLTCETDCMHRRCVNPSHLAESTPAANVRGGRIGRRTQCVHGHLYDEANTKLTAKGHRQCRTCARDFERRKRQAR